MCFLVIIVTSILLTEVLLIILSHYYCYYGYLPPIWEVLLIWVDSSSSSSSHRYHDFSQCSIVHYAMVNNKCCLSLTAGLWWLVKFLSCHISILIHSIFCIKGNTYFSYWLIAICAYLHSHGCILTITLLLLLIVIITQSYL